MKALSEREMQVAELLSWGLTDKMIATRLFISFDTVRAHHRNIYQKLSICNVADLTRWYFESTQKIDFGLSPKARVLISALFLALTFFIEFHNLTAIRVRAPRTQTSRVSRAKRSKKNETYQLAS